MQEVYNLAPELQTCDWSQQLENMGLHWHPIINQNHWTDFKSVDNRWNDFSQVDAVVAVRSFNSRSCYLNKPATKLYNAWLAGVPAILGAESAYQAQGEPGSNYLEVKSYDDLVGALEQLKRDRVLRLSLVQNGRIAARSLAYPQIIARWCDFLENRAIPAYKNWCEMPYFWQQVSLETNHFSWIFKRAIARISNLVSQYQV